MPANEVKLEVYTFKIRQKKNKDEYENLSDFFGNNFKAFITNFFNSYQESNYIDDKLKKSFKIPEGSSHVNISTKTASGMIDAGDFGIKSEIQNPDGTAKATKNKDDLDVKKFYFLLKVPEKSEIGFIILQRTGMFGISSIFQDIFINFFESNYINHRIFINLFVSEETAKEVVKNGVVKELEIVRYAKSSDEVDWLNEFASEDGRLKIRVSITAERSSFPLKYSNEAAKFMNNKKAAFFDIANLSELGFTEENSSYSIKVKGSDNRSHNIDLSGGAIKPYYNIENEIEKDPDTQLPTFKSIDAEAKRILKDIIKPYEK